MRIRKGASRLLGAAYSSVPAPDSVPHFELPLPPPPPTRLYPESHAGGGGFAAETASGEPCCGLNRSPWDLIDELSLSDLQEEELVETYLVHVACRSSWLFPATMPAASVKDEENAEPWHRSLANKKTTAAKSTVVKEDDEKKDCKVKSMKAKVKKEDGDGEAAVQKEEVDGEAVVQVSTCRKSNGKMWRCRRPVSLPNQSLCDYHLQQKRPRRRARADPELESTSTAAASRPSTGSKIRTKKKQSADGASGEEFYYYTGFGTYWTKRHRSSDDPHQLASAEQEENELQAAGPAVGQAQADGVPDHQSLGRLNESSHDEGRIAGIAGSDEESSDDSVSVSKRWKKPVKARSLKSLM